MTIEEHWPEWRSDIGDARQLAQFRAEEARMGGRRDRHAILAGQATILRALFWLLAEAEEPPCNP